MKIITCVLYFLLHILYRFSCNILRQVLCFVSDSKGRSPLAPCPIKLSIADAKITIKTTNQRQSVEHLYILEHACNTSGYYTTDSQIL